MSQTKQTSLYLPVSDIVVNLRNRYKSKYKEVDSFVGYDSETYQGKCKLLCNSKGKYVLDGNFYDYLDFLFDDSDDNSHRVFWNMNFDLTAIFKLYKYKDDKIKRLLDGYKETFKNYELSYLKPKFFTIKKGNKQVVYTDLFFIYKMSLNNASKSYLKDEKIDEVDGKILNESLDYWNDNLDLIIEYCIKDCELTENLGNFLIEKVKQVGIKIPKYITSHASFSRQIALEMCKIPSIRWTPINILDIATQTYFGGRFEVLQKGMFKKLRGYDLNSAYPDTIRRLPSLKYGIWNVVRDLKDVSKKETIGFYKCRFRIPKGYISPFVIKNRGIVVNPDGYFETWITWYELDLLRKDVKYFKLDYGYEYKPSKREYYPFEKMIDYLYERKSFYKYDKKEKDEVLSWIFKIIMNALYGCFIERHDVIMIDKNDGSELKFTQSGKLFNPVYASIITARTRWKLLKDSGKRNRKHIVGFHTDSVISDKFLLRLWLKRGKKLGKWTMEKKGKSLIIMTGIYQIKNTFKNRGFTFKKQKNIKELKDDNARYNWFDIIKSKSYEVKNCNECKNYKKCNPRTKLQFQRLKVMKASESMKRWNNLERANEFTYENKCLDINSDKKRLWNDDFNDVNEILTRKISSQTITLHYVRNDELH
jgi:hypothetical protein